MSLNRVTVIGRLGKDPEVKNTTNGSMAANFSLAVNEKWGAGDKKQERTEWIKCVCFGKTAELVSKYASKGRQIYVEGRLQTRSWDGKDGNKQYATEVVVSSVVFLGDGSGRSVGAVPDDMPPPAPINNEDDIPF